VTLKFEQGKDDSSVENCFRKPMRCMIIKKSCEKGLSTLKKRKANIKGMIHLLGNKVSQNWVLILVVLVFLAVRMLWLETTISRDEGANGLVGFFWTRGILPTYWLNTQGPMIYVVYAIVISVFGNGIIPIRIVNNFLFIGSCFVLYKLASGWFGKSIGVLTVVFYGVLMNTAILEAMTALTEPISVPFVLISIYFFVKYRKLNLWRDLVFSGFFMSVASLIRVTNAMGFLPLAIVLLYDAYVHKFGFCQSFKKFGLIVLSSLVPIVITIAYFALLGDFKGLVDIYFRAASLATSGDVPGYIKFLILVEGLPSWVFAAIGTLVAFIVRKKDHVLVLLIAASFFFISLVPPTFGHRMIFFLPAISILSGIGLCFVLEKIKNPLVNIRVQIRNWRLTVKYMALLLAIIVLFVPSIYFQSKQFPQMNLTYGEMNWMYADANYEIQTEVSRYIRAHTMQEDSIFVDAWSAELYWLAEKFPPSKYVWSLEFLPETETIRISNMIRNTDFKYIVVFSDSYEYLFLRAESSEPLAKYFLRYYFLEQKIGNAYVFSKNDNTGAYVIYSFVDKFQDSKKYYDSVNGTFSPTENLATVFHPLVKIFSAGDETQYSIQQTPLDQSQLDFTSKSYIGYDVHIPPNASLRFAIGFDPPFRDRAYDTRFQILIRDENGLHIVFDEILYPRNETSSIWKNKTVNLTSYGNQDVEVIFATCPGPSNINIDSYANWGNPVIVTNG
jgi:hypothetical protein